MARRLRCQVSCQLRNDGCMLPGNPCAAMLLGWLDRSDKDIGVAEESGRAETQSGPAIDMARKVLA